MYVAMSSTAAAHEVPLVKAGKSKRRWEKFLHTNRLARPERYA